jgi:predicted nucleic acid-binding protein
MKLFLDANILFSAAQSTEGRARGLFVLAADGHCNLLSSEHATNEACRNLMMKSPSSIGVFRDLLKIVRIAGEGGPGLVAWAAGYGLPENDAPILAAAAAARADLLVTGDRRHFGHLYGEVLAGVQMVTLREALKLVSST